MWGLNQALVALREAAHGDSTAIHEIPGHLWRHPVVLQDMAARDRADDVSPIRQAYLAFIAKVGREPGVCCYTLALDAEYKLRQVQQRPRRVVDLLRAHARTYLRENYGWSSSPQGERQIWCQGTRYAAQFCEYQRSLEGEKAGTCGSLHGSMPWVSPAELPNWLSSQWLYGIVDNPYSLGCRWDGLNAEPAGLELWTHFPGIPTARLYYVLEHCLNNFLHGLGSESGTLYIRGHLKNLRATEEHSFGWLSNQIELAAHHLLSGKNAIVVFGQMRQEAADTERALRFLADLLRGKQQLPGDEEYPVLEKRRP